MANYTMTIQEMMNNPLIGVFDFDYPFYTEDEKMKKQFEETFIAHYYLHEIGFETAEGFKQRLEARLKLIMPYYEQLYKTEWFKQKTEEQMMTSKNLSETTEHKQSITGENETESQGSSSSHQSDSMNQSSTSSGTNTSSSTTNEKQSNLADGVAQASLSDGYLTAVGESANNSTSTISSTDTSDSSSSTQGTAEQSGKTTGSNKQELTESTTFISRGDVGIQTPAYAIAEWRKVLININQMIIEDCRPLFMSIY